MIECFKTIMKRWKDFTGISDRREFWLGYLGSVIILIIASIPMALFSVLATTASDGAAIFGILGAIFALAYIVISFWVCIASIAAMVRRLRDAGFHWAFVFLSCVGFAIVPLVMCALESKTPTNTFMSNDENMMP